MDCVDLEGKVIYVQRTIKRVSGSDEMNDLKNSSSYQYVSMSDRLVSELRYIKKNKVK